MTADHDHKVSNNRQNNHAENVQMQILIQFLGLTFSEKLIKKRIIPV